MITVLRVISHNSVTAANHSNMARGRGLKGCSGGGCEGVGSESPRAVVLPLSVLVKPLKWCFVPANSISHVSSFNSVFRDSNELKRSLMKTGGFASLRGMLGERFL